jgi:hypothetical protein
MSSLSPKSVFFRLLKNRIDISEVPFSDRGSRILVYKEKDKDKDQLFIKLAERLTNLQPGLETYIKRPSYIQGLVLVDEVGTELEFEVESYPHVLFFHTKLGIFSLTFRSEHTLAIGLPHGVKSGIQFCLEGEPLRTERGASKISAIRNLYYQTQGEVLKHWTQTKSGYTQVKLILGAGEDHAIYLSPEWPGHAPMPSESLSVSIREAERRWEAWFTSVPEISSDFAETYYYAWWVMANNLVSPLGYLQHEAMMPSKHFYVGIWNWDACLHAIALRHVDIELARNQLRTLLDWQLPDGMIPDVVYDEAIVDHIDHPIPGRVTKPPIMAWAAMKLHETHPDLRFLEEIYPSLVRWNGWWFSENDTDGDGIVQYTHPYSSGLDDSPLWDHGFPVESPDINTYLCLQMQSLAEMARELDLQEQASDWKQRSDVLVKKMMEHFYDPEAGLFWATHDHKPIPELTPFNLFPLWTGQLDVDVVKKLIAHLNDPQMFWAPYPLSTVARNCKNYSPEIMWRGPVWVNINYFFIEALNRSAYRELAQKLREKTLSMLAQNQGIYEFYNPETGQAAKTAVPIFGWTASVFIDLLLQGEPSGSQ